MRLTDLISPEDLQRAIGTKVPNSEMNKRCDENVELIKVCVAFLERNSAIPAEQKRYAKITATFVLALIDEAIENATKGVKQ